MSAPVVEVGTKLPELSLYGDPTFIVSTALATRDFQDVHHDRDKAQAKGSKDIFVNILTDTGLVQRYITDWAGPSALVKSIALRLGVPWYAYDTVTFSGEVTAVEDGLVTVKVVGSNSLGDHVIATATLTIGGGLMLSGKAAIVGIGATDFSKNSGPQRVAAGRRGGAGRTGRRGAHPGRRRRADHVHDGLQHRDRRRPGGRHRRVEVLLQDPLRRRRRLRDHPAGRDGGGHRCRRRAWWRTGRSTSGPVCGSARCRPG